MRAVNPEQTQKMNHLILRDTLQKEKLTTRYVVGESLLSTIILYKKNFESYGLTFLYVFSLHKSIFIGGREDKEFPGLRGSHSHLELSLKRCAREIVVVKFQPLHHLMIFCSDLLALIFTEYGNFDSPVLSITKQGFDRILGRKVFQWHFCEQYLLWFTKYAKN